MTTVEASLQTQLDAITERTRALVPPDRLALTDEAIAELLGTGIEDRILPAGAHAPEFTLPAAHATALGEFAASNSRLVRSSDLLALGPLILIFFRGRWDPYCMTTLEAWQRVWAELRRSRHTEPDPEQRPPLIVGISPQLPRQNDFTAQQHGITFPLLADAGCALAAQFGLTYTVPENLQRHFRSILINIPWINGDESWRLPLPGAYLIDQSGVITFAEAHADHRVRTEPAELLANL